MVTPEHLPHPEIDDQPMVHGLERTHTPIRLSAFKDDGRLALRPVNDRSWHMARLIDWRRQQIDAWEQAHDVAQQPSAPYTLPEV